MKKYEIHEIMWNMELIHQTDGLAMTEETGDMRGRVNPIGGC